MVVFLNVGDFNRGRDGRTGQLEPEFYTLPVEFIKAHHETKYSWQKVQLRKLGPVIEPYKNERGFEHIAEALGVAPPSR